MRTTSTKRPADIRREVKLCPTCRYRFSRDAAFCPFDGVKLEPAPFDPLADPLIGTRVDARYDVVSILGEGGMGRIYRVRHAALDRAFAMKVLRPELAQDSELAARFILEAKATASVKHPNVVQITDFGRMPDGVPYFVMELLVGHTLGELIKAGGRSAGGPRGAEIHPQGRGGAGGGSRRGCRAPGSQTGQRLSHRRVARRGPRRRSGTRSFPGAPQLAADVPRRRLRCGENRGLESRHARRVVFGTRHYMSPEQASGDELDQRADIYSLGVIMYEMFTGRVPFEADTYMGVLTQHMFVRPTPPSRDLRDGGRARRARDDHAQVPREETRRSLRVDG